MDPDASTQLVFSKPRCISSKLVCGHSMEGLEKLDLNFYTTVRYNRKYQPTSRAMALPASLPSAAGYVTCLIGHRLVSLKEMPALVLFDLGTVMYINHPRINYAALNAGS
jgi:hypothetical protein